MSYTKNKSYESMEDYLETILLLQEKNGHVRSVDIAAELEFTKASVSIAMKNLREKEYITMAETGYISLTQAGLELAKNVLEKHNLLSSWLMRLGVSEKTAIRDACRIEHVISEETFDILKDHCK